MHPLSANDEMRPIIGLKAIADHIESHSCMLADTRNELQSLNGQGQFVRQMLLAPFTTGGKADEQWTVTDERMLNKGIDTYIKQRHLIDILPKRQYAESGRQEIAYATGALIDTLRNAMTNPALSDDERRNVSNALKEVIPDKPRNGLA